MNECNFCLLRQDHGGNCQGKCDGKPCLIFKRDPRGRRQYEDNCVFKIDFDTDIPVIGEPDTNWLLDGVTKTITFTRIRKVEWNKDAKGLHGIRLWADYWYWSHENGELPPEKPKLRLVKNGGKNE